MNPSEKTGIEPLLPMKLHIHYIYIKGEGIYTLFGVRDFKNKNNQNHGQEVK